jgi:hypothetical protein
MYLLVDREDEGQGRGSRDEARERMLTPHPSSLNPSGAAGNARRRYDWLLALHRAGEQDLLARGLDDAHAWLPPPIAKRFGRRLEALGWVRDDAWTPYCRRLKSSG